jgi:cytidylate kinase
VNKISIGGHVGSGKSSVAREVSALTGWPLMSTGAIFREIAERKGLTVLELNQHAVEHPEIDDEVDDHLRRLSGSPDPKVIDSRMAFHFVPDSLKVYLVVEPAVAARRIFDAGRHDERYATLEDAMAKVSARQDVEADRYHQLYDVRRDDWRGYDVVIDTTDTPSAEVAALVIDELADETTARPRCWMSPLRLLPTTSDETAHRPRIAVRDGLVWVTAGHDAVSAAIGLGDTLVRCDLASYEDGAVPSRDQISMSRIASWEEAHGIVFRSRPS